MSWAKPKGADMRRRRSFLTETDDGPDPLAGMANLFDVAMVFAVALIVAVVSFMKMGSLLTEDDVTIVKNPGKSDMEIIKKEGKQISKYKASKDLVGEGKGRRVGVAYQLEDGQIVYIPENTEGSGR